MREVVAAGVSPVPWRNGAGETRELARWPERAADPEWRVSLADLREPAAFSSFPGVERLFVPLGSVRLVVGRLTMDLQAGDQVRFPGEEAAHVVPLKPTRALNVMTRRGPIAGCVVLQPMGSPAVQGTDMRVRLHNQVADILFTNHKEGQHD